MDLQQEIERLYELPDAEMPASARSVFETFRELLSAGKIRAAQKVDDRWQVNLWVKKGILLGFRLGRLSKYDSHAPFVFFDKDTLPVKAFDLRDQVRVVPGGTTVRDGAYLAPGVIVMPPAYVNIGAYVDQGTLIDSHVLVGSCAQIGKRVHLSAGAQIGGVLEPVGALPVIIEDDVLVGGNCGVYEGTVVRRGAVLAAGTILTRSLPIYDVVRGCVIRAEEGKPLVVPENAVVVPGSRPVATPFAADHGLHAYCPLIVKYRDEKTDRATALEEALRR
ncbi:MAG: 2,3,4,5-tetrahydropyridine-2,6-dicarboxylate N-succinyltransferase [candidate division KSB1 bacterium]|nr:2,3,4,5-tetrahydropyridine-2,6-dicarboxylate N-succinyltransferase [candidate division KSB1 bacterium]